MAGLGRRGVISAEMVLPLSGSVLKQLGMSCVLHGRSPEEFVGLLFRHAN